ncbi:LANO_0B01090g1_1 [Lachancea nothofagi CBS 11611]|uniref:LANO_0B01090g1_1 n=1 Tax=Lachancea nothofagi CBS 11611 TaxID=1266666 RepID=A0A1G4IUR8_9SACH|nr:LANO_0B01090g1_1 [Lachancea nothofagi CBS 11611]
MDPSALLQCFAGTLDHNHDVRTEAESQLKMAGKTPGFLGACLDIISAADVPENIKLSAALYFKNKILYGWSGKQHGRNELLEITVDNDEKPVVKDMFVKALVQSSICSPNCMRLLQPALTTIVAEEYPRKQWDSLLSSSFELLSSNDVNSAHVGLLCLSEIFRTYRWKDNDSRQELEHLIMQYFPPLLEFASNTLLGEGGNIDNAKVGDMIKLVLKIYKFVTYHDLPFTLQRPDNFIAWANLHVAIIQLPLSPQILATDRTSRKNQPWVKAKKWAYANVSRLFQRYASTSLSRKFSYDEFKALFLQEFLPQLLQLYFQQIEQWSNQSLWLSDEAIHHVLGFLEQAVVQKATWPLIKPFYPILLEYVIYPLLCPTQESMETFESDPQEYIHRNLETWDDEYSPDFAALSLLTTCVSKRGKTTLKPTVVFVTDKLKANLTEIDVSEKVVEAESSLRIISNILDRLCQKNSPFANDVENILVSLVFPYFHSPHQFLKARVCEICSKLGDYQFKNEQTLQTLYNEIISCFMEESDCLPVELLAALAVQAFINVPEFQVPISANVVPMTQKLLRISNEIESDAVSGVLQEFVECFAEQLQPFGIELMNDLVQQFLKLAIDLNDSSNFDINNISDYKDLPDDTEKQMAALGILSTAISILLSFENSHDIVKSLEQSFYPAAEFILKNGMEDFYREVCEFLENSTFLLRDVTPFSWKILELIGECNRIDESMVAFYLEDFMLAFNNYLVYGQEELRKNSFYSNILFEVYCKAAANEDSSIDEIIPVFELSQKLVLALGSKIPGELLARFLKDALKAISDEAANLKKSIAFTVTSFNVIIACIACCPWDTLQFLGSQNALETFFNLWFDFLIPNYKRVYDIKLSTMALLSMVSEVSTSNLQSLSLGPVIAKSSALIVKLLTTLPQALNLLEEKRKTYSSDEFGGVNEAGWEDLGDYDEGGDDDDSDGPDEEDYLNFLNKEAQDLKFVDGGNDILNHTEGFEDLDEDPLSGSTIDSVNVYEVLKHVMPAIQSEAAKYQLFTSNLSQEDQQTYVDLLNL